MRILLYLFLFVWSLVVIGFLGISFFSRDVVSSTFFEHPTFQYVIGALGVERNIQQIDKNGIQASDEQVFMSERGYLAFNTFETTKEKTLSSPTFVFSGWMSDDIISLKVAFYHPSRGQTYIFDVPLKKGKNSWMFRVGVDNERLFRGENRYEITATFDDDRESTISATLFSSYETYLFGDIEVFMDEGLQENGDIWESKNLEGNSVYFMTKGCDPDIENDQILLGFGGLYKPVAACFTFSLEEDYFLWYAYRRRDQGAYLYDIYLGRDERIFLEYPLYIPYRGKIYYSLLFWDEDRRELQTMRSHGDQGSYTLRIEKWSVISDEKVLDVRVDDGAHIEVVTAEQRLILSLYDQRERKTSLWFPGVSHEYAVKSRGGAWKRISQGDVYSLPISVYAPRNGYLPTFTFRIYFDGGRMIVDDGVRFLTFSLDDIGATFQVKDREKTRPSDCSHVRVAMYADVTGDESILTSWDKPLLVISGTPTDILEIQHNDEQLFLPDHAYEGYAHARLGRGKNNLVAGKNIYRMTFFTEEKKEICSITYQIDVS